MAIYKSKWIIFSTWCNIQHINPLSAAECVVSDFLLHLHTEKHLAISTTVGHQMAIASTLRATSLTDIGRNHSLESLHRNIELEQGQHQRRFPGWNLALVLSSLTKPPFKLLYQASDQLLTWKTVFLIALASGKCRALRFYLERSAPWMEHKRLLFVWFKPGHNRDIDHPQSPVGSGKRLWSATQNTLHLWSATQNTLHLSSSLIRLRHTGMIHGCIPRTGLHGTESASWYLALS